jgi:hypothetical protein
MTKKHDVDTLQVHRERARREALDRIEAIERKLDAVIMGQGVASATPASQVEIDPRDVEDLGEILAAGSGCIDVSHSRPFQARGPGEWQHPFTPWRKA